ncbi:MAG: PrsW family intramembrane metalloprotease [Lachnospiraceae bacterium]|nr:PrsW family intramembrane metalloprotease [Lachnospiraceae bacterium]
MIYAENIMICIMVPFLIVFLFVRGKVKQFVLALLLGMAACLLGAYVGGFLGTVSGMNANDTAVYISPMIEETFKFFPFLFYLFLFDPEDDSLIVVAMGIGVGFASFENCCYILSYGANKMVYVLIRGMAVGVMHIVSMLSLCFGLIMARRLKALSFSIVLGALSLAMIFHSIYNLLVSKEGITSQIGYALPLLTAFVLYLYYRKFSSEQIADEDAFISD